MPVQLFSCNFTHASRRWVSKDKMPHRDMEPPTSVDVPAVAALLRELMADM